MSPPLRDGLTTAGVRYILDVRPDMTVWPLEPAWTGPPYQGNGRPRKPRLRGGQRQTMPERAAAIPEEAWQEITVAAGSQVSIFTNFDHLNREMFTVFDRDFHGH